MRLPALANWRFDSVWNTPPVSDSHAEGIGVESGRPGYQFRKAKTLAAILVAWGSSGVPHLFGTCGPDAIGLGVPKFVIFSLNGRAGERAFSHIAIERLEGLKPLGADRDSATTVIGIAGRAWISAPLFHCLPNLVQAGLASAVRSGDGPGVFENDTPATFSVSTPEAGPEWSGGSAAIALAEPPGMPLGGRASWDLLDDNKATKPAATHLYFRSHGHTFITVPPLPQAVSRDA